MRLISTSFILIILSLILYYSFTLLRTSNSKENYIFFGFVLLLFTVMYSVSVLGYRITGSNLGIEKAREEIKASKKEIAMIAETLLKISYVVADGSSRWNGIPREHLEKIKEYQKSLKGYLSSSLDQEVEVTLREVNKKIEQEINSQKQMNK